MDPRIERELEEILRSGTKTLPRETAWSRFRRGVRRQFAGLHPRGLRAAVGPLHGGTLLLISYALAVVLFFWRQDIGRVSPPLYLFLLLLMGVLLFAGYFLNLSSMRSAHFQPRWRGQVIQYRRRNPIEDLLWRLRHRR